MTPTELKQAIIEHSIASGDTLIESTLAIVDKFELEIEDIVSHINGSLKDMMRVECEASGLIKKDGNSSYTFE